MKELFLLKPLKISEEDFEIQSINGITTLKINGEYILSIKKITIVFESGWPKVLVEKYCTCGA